MLSWNVYIGNFNSGSIESYNVFRHRAFMEDCQKIVKKYRKIERSESTFDKASFSEEMRRTIMYYFWSKCEWEIVVNHWPPRDTFDGEKVDVFDQISLNWDIFIDYIWNHKEEIAKWKKC